MALTPEERQSIITYRLEKARSTFDQVKAYRL